MHELFPRELCVITAAARFNSHTEVAWFILKKRENHMTRLEKIWTGWTLALRCMNR